jgi:hypothetical protein
MIAAFHSKDRQVDRGGNMQTVFSHIVQKRFSHVNEDIATDALAFVLYASEAARNGMIKLLRGIVSDMPDLHFRTQQTEGSIRPDMWGFDDVDVRVFVENKFWAGLTDNQPISYLQQLAAQTQPTILLVVVPEARQETVWRELRRRLADADIQATGEESTSGNTVRSMATGIGPILALTSWTRLLSTLELEVADDPAARSDLLQLRALCEAADRDAFVPISSAEVTDQRIPAFILQLSVIVQDAVELAVAEGVLHIKGLMPQSSWSRIGRYVRFSDDNGIGAWIGVDFRLWKEHGGTPLWLVFSQGDFGRALEVRSLLEPWAAREGGFTAFENGELAVALDIPLGEDKDRALRVIVDTWQAIADVLSPLGSDMGDAE